ncbi:MAG: DUF4194 domain-containing protein [bacterium]
MLETYEKLNNSTKNTFSDICNKLLANSFLARDKRDNKEAYFFVISYKELFDEFFRVLNYELVIDRNVGAIQLYSDSVSHLYKLKKEESIILLILRLLYQEKLKETTLSTNIVITSNEIHEKYELLELRKRITKTDLVSVLRLFKKYNLLEPLGDITNSKTEVVLFPTLLQAINSQNVNEVLNAITKLNQEGEKDEKAN